MTNEPTVDVLLLIASESLYIEVALKSAAEQEGKKKIYIIENNIGNIEYRKTLVKLAETYGAEYVFFEKRLPMSENWQRALSVGKSEWITYLHDDDIWPKEHLSSWISKASEFDVLFAEYAFFRGAYETKMHDSPICFEQCQSREQLLAKMTDSYHHASATLFRRKLDIKFPSQLRMALDQYGFRQLVAEKSDIRVAWRKGFAPVAIRQHATQLTWQVIGLAAKENAICYRAFFKTISNEKIRSDHFAYWLGQFYTNIILRRIYSAVILTPNYRFAIAVLHASKPKTRAVIVAIGSIFRAALQNIVWIFKSKLNWAFQ